MRLSLPKFQYRFIPSLGHVIHPGNFHPVGVREGIARDLARARGQAQAAPGAAGRWLIVGGSGGFGSAARMILGARHGAHTLDLSFDAVPNLESKNRMRVLGSPGWHRSQAINQGLTALGLRAASVTVDVFAADATAQAIAAIREHLGGPLDGIIWSLAAPRAQDPRTGAVVASALKPYGEPAWVWTFTNRDAEGVSKIVSIPMAPGTPEEAVATQYVMGGRIVERWVDALQGAGILAPGCRLLTLTYRGSPLNAGIYRDGLIGLAKADLEFHTRAMGAVLKDRVGGSAHAVCGPAVVTEASGGIPGVPLYMATLLDVMGREHEDPVASMRRMFDEKISLDGSFAPVVDDEGLVRMDDRELSPVYLKRMTDRFHARHAGDVFEPELFDLFMRAYAQTRGFDVDGVDYEAEFDTDALT